MDLENKLQVSSEDGQAFAMGIGFEFCEVSALQSRNIDRPFKTLAQSFYNKFEEKVASLMEVWSQWLTRSIKSDIERKGAPELLFRAK